MSKKKESLYNVFRHNIIWMPLLIGIIFGGFELCFEVYQLNNAIIEKNQAYIDETKTRLVNEVTSSRNIAISIIKQYKSGDITEERAVDLVVDTLESISSSGLSYIFVVDYFGNSIVGPGKGFNMYEIADKNGKLVVQELIKKAKDGGGFIEYIMPPVNDEKEVQKLSYVLPIESMDWYIGSGVMMDDIDETTAQIIRDAKEKMVYRFVSIIIAIMAAIYIMGLYNKKTYVQIKEQVDLINQFLRKGQHQYSHIEPDFFTLNEFSEIAVQTQLLMDAKEAHEEQLEFQAFHDYDTGYANRRYFNIKLNELLEDCCTKSHFKGAIVFLDIDNFKLTNDTFGHKFGDKVIKSVGDHLSKICPNALISRFGGDEFTLLLSPLESEGQLEVKLKAILESFNQSLNVEGRCLQMSVSIGTVVFPKHGVEVEDLLRKADLAMYNAKDNGRNRYEIFSESLLDGNFRNYKIESELKQAIQNDEFLLHYQPQYASKSYDLVGFECLIRWQNPKLGMVMPNDFIPFAEQSGFINNITQNVMKKAADFILKLQEHGQTNIKISINITPQDILHEDFKKWLEIAFEQKGISPKLVFLELTESDIVNNINQITSTMDQLRLKGYRIVIDDFGTGFSSLNYLVALPIDILKIDQSFVRDMLENPKQLKMVEVILEIAENLGFDTVAEGIETEAELKKLEALKATVLQGYYFSKPLDEEHALKLLDHF